MASPGWTPSAPASPAQSVSASVAPAMRMAPAVGSQGNSLRDVDATAGDGIQPIKKTSHLQIKNEELSIIVYNSLFIMSMWIWPTKWIWDRMAKIMPNSRDKD